MVLTFPKDFNKVIERSEGGVIRDQKIIKAFVKEEAGKPTETFEEGALVINMAENRLYVQVNGAANQPTHHYKLNETSGTTASDSGSGGINGTASNAAIWTTSGKYSGGINLATHRVDLTSSTNFDFNDGDGDWTVELWVKFDLGSQIADEDSIFGKEDFAGGGAFIVIAGTPTLNNLAWVSETTAGSQVTHFTENTTIWNDGEFHHIALVHDDSADLITWYTDGNVKGSFAWTFNETDLDAVVGKFGNISATSIAGTIDEVKIWREARSQTQIVNDSLETGGLVWTFTSLTGA
ncbi:MAG: hypothetical protein O2871_04165 [bacterium]|nr:hypothetical protein [bacterium]